MSMVAAMPITETDSAMELLEEMDCPDLLLPSEISMQTEEKIKLST